MDEDTTVIGELELRPARLPERLRHLASFMPQWAIGDDVVRAEKREQASAAELRELVEAVSPHWDEINAYLDAAHEETPVPDEAILLGYLAECAAEAQFDVEDDEAG